MVSKKLKRHSGWCSGISTIKESKQYIIENCLEPQLYYDRWNEYRDGQRAWMCDSTKLCKKSVLLTLQEYCDDEYYCQWYRKKLDGHYKQKKLLLIKKAQVNHKV